MFCFPCWRFYQAVRRQPFPLSVREATEQGARLIGSCDRADEFIVGGLPEYTVLLELLVQSLVRFCLLVETILPSEFH